MTLLFALQTVNIYLDIVKSGNQRDKAREKNLRKQKEQEKKKTSGSKDGNRGMSLEERRHRDAEIMRQKQDKKQVQISGESSGGATGGASK